MPTEAAVVHFALPVAGELRATAVREPVRNPYDGRIVATVGVATQADMNDAIAAASGSFAAFADLARHQRRTMLAHVADSLLMRKLEFVRMLTAESGKPHTFGALEVDRAVTTFRLAAEEATRGAGEFYPLDIAPASAEYSALVSRFPIGVIGAIAPFNFPLNLVAHKLAPALAVGNTLVLKPPPQAPLSALMLAEVCYEAGVPREAFSVVHCPVNVAQMLATDERIAMLSFTGSAGVGWSLKALAGKKRVVLELGGNAAAIVAADADVAWAAKRCALGAFAQSGQVCISVQRILVDESVWDRFVGAFVRETHALRAGDPEDPQTTIGPMIDRMSATRIAAWIGEAIAGGAEVLKRGRIDGNMVEPFILTNTTREMKVECEEVFGPVATVTRVRDFDEALRRANDSRYGLQAGVFTNDLRHVREAYRRLEVGGVIINDYPTFRADNFPYGGVKDSGLGREGVRYAMDEMTELKTLVMKVR